MITILLTGGLGNQLFQYAAGMALAKRLNTSLAIDTLYYRKKTRGTYRHFELDVFDTELKFRSDWRNMLFVKYKLFLIRHKSLLKIMNIFCDENALIYEPAFQSLTNGTILSGYFQNECYFKDTEAELRKVLQFKKPLAGQNLTLLKNIIRELSVSIHIRRGDYVNDPTVNMNVCDVGYYNNAIHYFKEKIINPHFFVFSDDMEWVKNNIDFKSHSVTFVDWNSGSDSYIDMQLMSICTHNIIANSTFSWWGAWLNNNPDKIVISPRKWFKNNGLYDSREDYLPSNWIKL